MRSLARVVLFVVATLFATGLAAQEPGAVAPLAQPVPDREIQVAADAFTRDPTLPAWVLPRDVVRSKTSGPSVIELHDTQAMVGPTPAFYVRRVIRAEDPAVLSSAGRVAIVFVPAYQKLVLHTLRIHRDGVVLDRLPTAQVRFLQRETGLENNLYSGIVTASILVDDLRTGDLLETAFSTIGTNPVFGPTFGASEGWDQTLPVADRRLIVNVPASRPLRWKAHGRPGLDVPKPTDRTRDGLRTLTFEERDLPAVPPEVGVPAGITPFRWVQFSEYADWNAVAAWATPLFADDEAPSPERETLVAQFRNKATDEERAVAALEFVQSQVRYFSVSLGTSSHRPTAPNLVLSRRYGDCKDKSLLLVSLLKALGIPATPVLLRAGNRTGFDDWLPTPLAFDHVIVRVDLAGTSWYLDPTRLGQHGRLARMGQVHDGVPVLPVSADTTALVRIEVPDRDALALDTQDEKVAIAKIDGDADLQVTQVVNGVNAEVLRVATNLMPRERLDTALTSAMDKRYPGAKLVESAFDDDRIENRFTLRTRYTLPKPLARTSNGWQFKFRADNVLRALPLVPDGPRRLPFVLRFPTVAQYRLEAEVPEEVAAASPPFVVEQADRWFRATSHFAFRGNRVTAVSEARTLADRAEAADRVALAQDVGTFRSRFPDGFVIRDVDRKQSGFLGIGGQDVAAITRARQEDLVKRVTATIDGGRISGSDLARAYCQRGAARMQLERSDEAVRDGDAAVAIDPNAPEFVHCRGTIRLGIGDFAGAVQDFNQAIVLGDVRGSSYEQRGRAHFLAGRDREAAADFAKAAELDRGQPASIYQDTWRAMALARLGQPLPDDLRKQAETAAQGEWPRPLLALTAKAITPDQLRALLATRTGDERVLDTAEAEFYLGERALAEGDTAAAIKAFQAVREAGIVTYVEYHAARSELQRLQAGKR